MKRLQRWMVLVVVLVAFTTVQAQTATPSATCGAMATQAMTEVENVCSSTGRNQACYGYVSLEATPRDGVANFTFTHQGDIADVADMQSVKLEPLDSASNVWGVLLMKLQASLPDTLPGQNVTFLLFGDVEIQNAVDPDKDTNLQPMQAFYIRTGITQMDCNQAPSDGVLIQTPQGAGKVSMRANGVDIKLGSTAFFQAQDDGNLSISVLEGESYVRSHGTTVIVPDGSGVQIPIDENLMAESTPSAPEAYDYDFFDDLAVNGLPDDIEIAEPSSDEELLDAAERALEQDELDDIDEWEQEHDESFDEDHHDQSDSGFEDEAMPPDDGGGFDDGE